MQKNIIEYFEAFRAQGCMDSIAIEDGKRKITFSELDTLSKRCAASLVRRKDIINRPISVFLAKSAELVVANLGILHSGNIFSNLDVKSPAQRIGNIIGNIKPDLIITTREHLEFLLNLGVSPDDLVLIEMAMAEGEPFDEACLMARKDRIIDTDPLCIINTSGSTGTPKGVVLSHRGLIDFMDWAFLTLNLDGSERIGSLSPFYFDIYLLELCLCLAKGATIVLIPDQLGIFPARLMPFLQENAISFLFWVPSIMVTISNQDLLEKFPLPEIKTVLFAGEVFPMKHLNKWRRALPQATFVNLYGPIEIHVDCTYFVLDRDFKDDDPLPIGFPCRNTDVLILNESNQVCKPGEPGELCVRGSSLAMGYWNDPEKTQKAFTQNPLNPHYPELIYRTGDLVSLGEGGEIMFIGRKDFQIKHMGYRIELGEIEHQVLCIEGIANACVLYNAAKKEITLFFEATSDAITPAEIRKALGKVFPKYMFPTVFNKMAELPRNPNGKIDRNRLKLTLEAD